MTADDAQVLQEIARAVDSHQSFLIVSHVGPDGDSIGSGLALRLALTALGKHAVFVCTDGVPTSCQFLPDWQAVVRHPPPDIIERSECLFILDCDGSPSRTAAPHDIVQAIPYKVLIDHHRTTVPLGQVNWIDPCQPATAIMVHKVLKSLPLVISKDMAQCLMCGISTDTGNFRFSNTTPESLRAAADLVELGADPSNIAFKIFDERSLESTKLLGLALQKMETECEGRLMWTALEEKDFLSFGTGDESSENVVNYLRNVRGARMAVILRERRDQNGLAAHISVRATPELRADLFCSQFGGGGHAAAAGCRVSGRPFEQAVKEVIAAACEWLLEDHPALESE